VICCNVDVSVSFSGPLRFEQSPHSLQWVGYPTEVNRLESLPVEKVLFTVPWMVLSTPSRIVLSTVIDWPKNLPFPCRNQLAGRVRCTVAVDGRGVPLQLVFIPAALRQGSGALSFASGTVATSIYASMTAAFNLLVCLRAGRGVVARACGGVGFGRSRSVCTFRPPFATE
jgi:hypothetical protein